jgi:hypothetical protein
MVLNMTAYIYRIWIYDETARGLCALTTMTGPEAIIFVRAIHIEGRLAQI